VRAEYILDWRAGFSKDYLAGLGFCGAGISTS
jgi:hypothetical protein